MLLITLSVLAGVCLYAAIHHLWIARRLADRTHLWFALLCLAVTLYVLVKTGAYRAATVAELVSLRRWEIALGLVLIGMLPWFVVEYAGLRWRVLPAALTLLLAFFLVVHLILPYGVIFIESPKLEYLTLPWGEQVVDLRVHQRSAWFNTGWLSILLNFAFSGYVCAHQYRQGQSRKALALALALGVFLFFLLFNQAVNYGLVAFTHTAEFGFIALVLLMSAALSSELRRSAEARAASEARLRILVEQATDAIFLHDVQGRIVDVNPQACRVLGYSRDELLHMTVAEIEAEVSPARAQALWNALQPGVPATIEGQHRRKDGSVFPVEVRVGLFRADGRDLALAIARDISARRKAEAALLTSEERLRATLDNTPGVAVQWFDRSGRVLYWNTASEKLYAIPAAQAVGKTMLELLHTPAQFREFLAFIAALEKDGTSFGPAEIDIRSVHGAEVSVLYTMFMIPGSGDEPIFVCMDVDISERKRAEAELQRHRGHLEELVEARTAQLEMANRELEAFSYSVSHDLRAPLRAIDGFSRILVEDYAAQLNAEARGYLERVCNAVQRMGRQIDELLELSRVGRAEMRQTDVDLGRLANEVVEQLRAGDPARTVHVTIAPALIGRGDDRLLRLVLENLLGNAWKYTRHTTDARIEFGAMQQNGETVYGVRDNGTGFDMAYVDKLFKPFQRLHRAEDFEGTGVGLAIVARIVTRHGGRVWAEGQAGKGASFFFTLPSASGTTSPQEHYGN
jgi:PAS domain S-box-containing protein